MNDNKKNKRNVVVVSNLNEENKKGRNEDGGGRRITIPPAAGTDSMIEEGRIEQRKRIHSLVVFFRFSFLMRRQ